MTKQTKPKTKKAQLIQLLTRKAGADVGTISDRLTLNMLLSFAQFEREVRHRSAI